jgi:uncharacterized protein DUF732
MTRTLAAVAIALLLNTGTAHADPSDDAAFVDALASRGLTCDSLRLCGHTQDTSNLVAEGKLICATLNVDGGNVSGASSAVARGAGISQSDGAFMVAQAITHYCPEFQR